MPDFITAFLGALGLNVALTLRSTDLGKQILAVVSALWGSPTLPPAAGTLKATNTGTHNTSTTETPLISKTNAPTPEKQTAQWEKLIFRYLIVYLLATSADWLQGAYIFILYHAFGYSKYDIGVLFIAGFGSSALFGSFMGGMADTHGRRLFVVVYGASYALSCIVKHFDNFFILLIGRVLGGIATSLLFSIFEAWLIRAHAQAGLQASWISKSFTWAAYGNSIVAIVSGLIANHVTESNTLHTIGNNNENNTIRMYMGGYLNPFDLALLASIATAVAALLVWEENYGDTTDTPRSDAATRRRRKKNNPQACGGIHTACTVTLRSREILLCGMVSSLYEASMYIFIFIWTPAMMEFSDESSLPFGLIFSTFMVYSMAGSSLFSIGNEYYSLEYLALFVFVLATASMGILLWTKDATVQYAAMNLFEMTIGMYFPVIGCLKSKIVPESQRAAIYNLYRIPLNLIVLFGLITDISPWAAFGLNIAMLLTASVLQLVLINCRKKNGRIKVVETDSLTEESDLELDISPASSPVPVYV